MVLLSITSAGVLTFLFLRPTPWATSDSAASSSPAQILRSSFKLLVTPGMLLLVLTFAYTGLVLTFWSGVYGTCIGRTKLFGEDAKSLVGLHGIGKSSAILITSSCPIQFSKVNSFFPFLQLLVLVKLLVALPLVFLASI